MTFHKSIQETSEIWQVEFDPSDAKFVLTQLVSLPESVAQPTTSYTTIRTYHREGGVSYYLYLDRHIQRLTETLLKEGLTAVVEPELLKGAIYQVETSTKWKGDLRIKILIGAGTRNTFYFIVEPLSVPKPDAYTRGVMVFTTRHVRLNPEAKTIGFIEQQETIRSEYDRSAEEILLQDESGNVLEGLSSNFFGIIVSNMFTAGEGVLKGITRQTVLDVARKNGLNVILKAIHMSQLEHLSECFITSTSRGILPVVRIDQKMIGSGKPGPITQNLMRLDDQEIENLIKPI